MYEGVGLIKRVKIIRNQSKMARFSPVNALSEQSLNTAVFGFYEIAGP